MGATCATARPRLAAALARPREGRHAHGDRRGAQRALGPPRQARGPAALAPPQPPQPGRDRLARRLPLPHRRAHARRGARDPDGAPSPHREARIARLLEDGFPAYTTSPGWLGYSDEKLARLCREAVADGFPQIKLKVGADLADDRRRMRIARANVPAGYPIAIDANQRWDVAAGDRVGQRAQASSTRRGSKSPRAPTTSSATRRSRAASRPIRVATGEHVQNRVVFKQLLQAGGVDVMQIDATRVGGVNENIANLLLAAKFGIPVCPHAGGVGLCEAVQHLSMFDFVAVSGSVEGRMIEYVDHLHEHFVTPVEIRSGRYLAPTGAGRRHRDAPRLDRRVHLARRRIRGGRMTTRLGRLGLGTAPLGNLYRAVDDDRALRDAARRRGMAASATSTPPRTTASGSPRSASAPSCATSRATSSSSRRRSDACSSRTPAYAGGRDLANGFDVPDRLVRRFDPTLAGVRRSLEDSLERMGLDRVDILYLHDPDVYDLDWGLREGLPALAALRDEGLVDAIGVGVNDSAVADPSRRRGRPRRRHDRGPLHAPRADRRRRPAARRAPSAACGSWMPRSSTPACSRPRDPGAGAHYNYGGASRAHPRAGARARARLRRVRRRAARRGAAVPAAQSARRDGRRWAPRTRSPITENIARMAERVPDELWRALADRGLVAEPVLSVGRPDDCIRSAASGTRCSRRSASARASPACWRSTTSTSSCATARCSPSSARTAPASPPS